jgi:hypothetical protein
LSVICLEDYKNTYNLVEKFLEKDPIYRWKKEKLHYK